MAACPSLHHGQQAGQDETFVLLTKTLFVFCHLQLIKDQALDTAVVTDVFDAMSRYKKEKAEALEVEH